jgi:hypothetical protein
MPVIEKKRVAIRWRNDELMPVTERKPVVRLTPLPNQARELNGVVAGNCFSGNRQTVPHWTILPAPRSRCHSEYTSQRPSPAACRKGTSGERTSSIHNVLPHLTSGQSEPCKLSILQRIQPSSIIHFSRDIGVHSLDILVRGPRLASAPMGFE